jgi:hypothetical protein
MSSPYLDLPRRSLAEVIALDEARQARAEREVTKQQLLDKIDAADRLAALAWQWRKDSRRALDDLTIDGGAA